MVNRVYLEGIISSDLEIRYFSSDYLQIRFSVETVEEILGLDYPLIQYHNIIVRGELARSVELSLEKGAEISLEGRLRYRKETDSLGQNTFRTDIECLSIRHISKPLAEGHVVGDTKPDIPQAISELPWDTFAPDEGEDPLA